jgi:hypothetical protein
MRLRGKTNRGKNVVQRDGSFWCLIQNNPSVICFNGRPGLFIVPAGEGKLSASRWIETHNDPDFEVLS